MASVKRPPKPRTYNGSLSAAGWGRIYVRFMTIGHGMSVVSNEGQSRTGRSMYITRRTSGSFGVTLMVTSRREYDQLTEWIEGYGRALVLKAPSVGPVRVLCPKRNFDKVAIPSGITLGDDISQHTWTLSINFLGSRDPLPVTSDLISQFSMPATGDPELPYYYPGGIQLKGTDSSADRIFDIPDPPPMDPTPRPPGVPRPV